ncbi:MAG: response regulator transcription factor [Nitriliruptorales bacterium]|nr:response regulator transcription factor [Nitriliruptorales bacterium]
MGRATKLAPPLRVVIVDDHEVVRTGLVTAIKDHRIEVVGQAEDVGGAVAAVRETQPDVLILDVRLPGGGGHAVLRELGDDAPPTLAVSSSDERDDVLRTVGAGASGYLLKTAPVEDIAAAIRSTADGVPVFSPELAGHVMDLDLDAAEIDDPEWEALTDREREVLRLLARGHTYNKIAEALVVSPKTVETHVRNILHKLQLSNRHEAARWAMERGFE